MEGGLNLDEQTIVTTCHREGTDAYNWDEVCYNPLYAVTFYGVLLLIIIGGIALVWKIMPKK